MKKAISITLNGTIFQIEEDAYTRLDEYLKSIKEYYGAAEGKEIVFDIEASLAEKFSQGAGKEKKIITLKDVEEAIKIMGTVNEFEESAKEDSDLGNESENKIRRLFRNPDDVILGGVCSGIAVYFKTDPLFIRLLFIILTLFGGSGILIYLILWAIIPQAKNNAQKLEMRGRPVNLEEIQELAREKSQKLKAEGKNIIENVKNKRGSIYKILYFPIKLLGMLFILLKKIGLVFLSIFGIFIGIILLISFVAIILGLTVSLGILLFNINSPYIISDIPFAELSGSIYYYVGMVSAYFVVLIPLVFLTILSLTIIKRKNSFHQMFSITLIVIWILAVTGASVAAADLAPRINDYIVKAREKEKTVREYDFKDFSKIALTGEDLDVKIIQGDEFSVKISGEAGSLERLSLVLSDEELSIKKELRSAAGKWCFICWQKDVAVTIVMPKLDSVKGSKYVDIEMTGFSDDIYLELDGYSELAWKNSNESGDPYNVAINLRGYSELAADNLNADRLEISQNSYSDTYLNGQANILNAELSGYSGLDGSNFIARAATIKAFNYSDVVVGVTDSIYALAKNYSSVVYIGQPVAIDLYKYNYSDISNGY
jgi:phage shock protein PspC (stress-responsive transcriptional regulator)